MEPTKKVHAKLKLEVFGEEYHCDEITWSGSPLDLVKAIQEKLGQALMSLNSAMRK